MSDTEKRGREERVQLDIMLASLINKNSFTRTRTDQLSFGSGHVLQVCHHRQCQDHRQDSTCICTANNFYHRTMNSKQGKKRNRVSVLI